MRIIRSCGLLLGATLLFACGSTPQKAVSPRIENNPQVTTHDQPTISQLLEVASQKSDPYPELVEVAVQLADTDCPKALEVIELLMKQHLVEEDKNRLKYTGGQCLLQSRRITEAKGWISSLPDNADWLRKKHEVLYKIYEQEALWWHAANSWYYKAEPSWETESVIWELLSHLPTEELQLRETEISSIHHLVKLLIIQRNFTHDYDSANNALQQWLANHPSHVFHETLPASLQFTKSTPLIEGNDIALLLPLSGPRKAQGEAIKEGILAASFSQNSEDRNFTIIDTNTWSSGNLPSLSEFDLIVGPLLKQNIDLISDQLPENVPVLLLNRSDADSSQTNRYFFSLAPEDEAKQLAENLLQQGFKSPFVISNQNNAYQRMKTVFVETWHTRMGKAPEILDFAETREVRKGVNDNLALSASKQRIDQIRNMLKPELHAMERNRRDIDVIVVFANTTHTELINPLIEASISPFAEIIPVFASSRSHSRINTKNDLRDLRNLQFLDMPWMLPSREYSWLQNFSRKLWPERRDNLNRLFAMGYDAVNLLPFLDLLRNLPNQTWSGLTGEIMVDEYGRTTRTSQWAKFTEERVIALDHN